MRPIEIVILLCMVNFIGYLYILFKVLKIEKKQEIADNSYIKKEPEIEHPKPGTPEWIELVRNYFKEIYFMKRTMDIHNYAEWAYGKPKIVFKEDEVREFYERGMILDPPQMVKKEVK
jgi:hypothetical protein